jgi:hypothetical protein
LIRLVLQNLKEIVQYVCVKIREWLKVNVISAIKLSMGLKGKTIDSSISSNPPDKPIPPTTLTVTFTIHGNLIEELEKQIEWLKSLTPEELKKQVKIKIE